jgi:hypothetical protein
MSYGRPSLSSFDNPHLVDMGHSQYNDSKLPPIAISSHHQLDSEMHSSAAIDLDWLFDLPEPQQQSQPPSHEPPFFICEPFLIPAAGPLLENDRNAVLCSVARDLLSQYTNIPAEEMDAVKVRLAHGFSRSTSPGGGCRVNNQLLFQVLNEISSKYG